ncbi:small subunit ribosomal protein S4e [Nematocida displodere]|uniref:40S ribosomal protein S4 n=1 Tax=Nematocida displodere TaxID=1805483 RepID=A0A177EB92_9MICR|nr:small subunit ribosomal protein S4e [Nematocida displodere]
MVRGPRKHLKRLNAPKSWMLDKLGGTFAPRPRCGPHKLTESLPLCLIVRRKLSFAQNTKEVEYIIKNRAIVVDGKVRTDKNYPAGFMDVVSIPKIHEHYRILYNVSKKFCLQKITQEEAKFKLCKVVAKRMENKGILTIHTNDGRTIKYADPEIKIGDTVKFDLEKQEMTEVYKFAVGQTGFAFRGKNIGCSGIIREFNNHAGGIFMVALEDLNGRNFLTRADNIMVIGSNGESLITLTKERGIKTSAFMQSNFIYGELKSQEENENDLSSEESDEE